MKKSETAKTSQSPISGNYAELLDANRELRALLEMGGKRELLLRHRIDTEVADLIKERNFWFNLANDFRFHYSHLAIAREMGSTSLLAYVEAVKKATLDLLLSPAEPSSPIARNSSHDPNARRQGFGIATDSGFVDEVIAPKEVGK